MHDRTGKERLKIRQSLFQTIWRFATSFHLLVNGIFIAIFCSIHLGQMNANPIVNSHLHTRENPATKMFHRLSTRLNCCLRTSLSPWFSIVLSSPSIQNTARIVFADFTTVDLPHARSEDPPSPLNEKRKNASITSNQYFSSHWFDPSCYALITASLSVSLTLSALLRPDFFGHRAFSAKTRTTCEAADGSMSSRWKIKRKSSRRDNYRKKLEQTNNRLPR